MKKLIKLLVAAALTVVLGATLFACAPSYKEQTYTTYGMVHQGYVGEATVTVKADGKVKSAELHEYIVTEFLPTTTDTIYRVKDSMANVSATDTNVKGWFFYQYNGSQWLQYNPTINAEGTVTGFTRHGSRDIRATFADNALRMKDYVAGAKANQNGIVTISGVAVTAGDTVNTLMAAAGASYKVLDKTDKDSGYMAIGTGTIGYRFNAKATVDFFIANPKVNVSSATLKALKITLTADATVTSEAIATYTAESDNVWHFGDVSTGATWSDMPQYLQLLQSAYYGALAVQRG